MISLDKYTYFMITAKMYILGFALYEELYQEIEIWVNPQTQRSFKIENKTGLFSEKELLTLLKEAHISVNEFLNV